MEQRSLGKTASRSRPWVRVRERRRLMIRGTPADQSAPRARPGPRDHLLRYRPSYGRASRSGMCGGDFFILDVSFICFFPVSSASSAFFLRTLRAPVLVGRSPTTLGPRARRRGRQASLEASLGRFSGSRSTCCSSTTSSRRAAARDVGPALVLDEVVPALERCGRGQGPLPRHHRPRRDGALHRIIGARVLDTAQVCYSS